MRNAFEWEHMAAEVPVPRENNWANSVRKVAENLHLLSPQPEQQKKTFLFSIGPEKQRNPKANICKETRPTMIICPGSGCNFQMLKKSLIPAYLKRGINVMVVNYRGYGNSESIPFVEGMSKDVETAYHYLSEIKKIPNNKIIAHGHCIGGYFASKLAKDHPGMHLVLDRSLANYRDAIKDSLTKSTNDYLLNTVMPKIPQKLKSNVEKIVMIFAKCIIEIIARSASFMIGKLNTANNVKHVNTKILIIDDKNDETLDQRHSQKLRKKAPIYEHFQTNQGHSGTWIDDPLQPQPSNKFDQFLKSFNALGSLA